MNSRLTANNVCFLPKKSTILPVIKGPKNAPNAGIELNHTASPTVTKIFDPGFVIKGKVGELHDITHVAAVAHKLAGKNNK